MNLILLTAAVLVVTGMAAATLLYWAARRFKVEEDPRIDRIEALLPGANCGGCGRNGCREFAAACVGADTLRGLVCPGSSDETMAQIAAIVGLDAVKTDRKIAVVRCGGCLADRPVRASYDGVATCAMVKLVAAGTLDCPYGCLGCGDCAVACPYGAIRIDPTTGLPDVDPERCVGCGVCVGACPRSLIELRPAGPRGLRVWVACSSHSRGALAMKECKAACIGCGKCVRTCPHGAITLSDNLAYIDPQKCRLCRKCVAACPTHAIHDSFPTPLPPQETPKIS